MVKEQEKLIYTHKQVDFVQNPLCVIGEALAVRFYTRNQISFLDLPSLVTNIIAEANQENHEVQRPEASQVSENYGEKEFEEITYSKWILSEDESKLFGGNLPNNPIGIEIRKQYIDLRPILEEAPIFQGEGLILPEKVVVATDSFEKRTYLEIEGIHYVDVISEKPEASVLDKDGPEKLHLPLFPQSISAIHDLKAEGITVERDQVLMTTDTTAFYIDLEGNIVWFDSSATLEARKENYEKMVRQGIERLYVLNSNRLRMPGGKKTKDISLLLEYDARTLQIEDALERFSTGDYENGTSLSIPGLRLQDCERSLTNMYYGVALNEGEIAQRSAVFKLSGKRGELHRVPSGMTGGMLQLCGIDVS
jgi:hypothetical protein